MRGTVAKRLRRDARLQVATKATAENRATLWTEIDGLYNHKKRKYRKPLPEPKENLTRRQDRNLRWETGMPAARYRDRIFTRFAVRTRMKRRRK